MFHVLTPDTMTLTLRTIRCAGRIQLSVGMIAYLDLAKPNVKDLLPSAALREFQRRTSWLRHLASPQPAQGSHCSIVGLAYAPADAAQGEWKVQAVVGALRASSAAGLGSHVQNDANMHGVGPIRLSPKAVGRGRQGPSQQLASSELIGNENITIHHMHPQQAILTGRLPGLRARCFIKMRVGSHDVIRKVDSTLERLWLFPNNQTGVVRYRALMPLDIVGGTFDIQRLVAGWEAIDAPNTATDFYLDLLNAVQNPAVPDNASDSNAYPFSTLHGRPPLGAGNERIEGGVGGGVKERIPPDWIASRCWHTGGALKATSRTTAAGSPEDLRNKTSLCVSGYR